MIEITQDIGRVQLSHTEDQIELRQQCQLAGHISSMKQAEAKIDRRG